MPAPDVVSDQVVNALVHLKGRIDRMADRQDDFKGEISGLRESIVAHFKPLDDLATSEKGAQDALAAKAQSEREIALAYAQSRTEAVKAFGQSPIAWAIALGIIVLVFKAAFAGTGDDAVGLLHYLLPAGGSP